MPVLQKTSGGWAQSKSPEKAPDGPKSILTWTLFGCGGVGGVWLAVVLGSMIPGAEGPVIPGDRSRAVLSKLLLLAASRVLTCVVHRLFGCFCKGSLLWVS